MWKDYELVLGQMHLFYYRIQKNQISSDIYLQLNVTLSGVIIHISPRVASSQVPDYGALDPTNQKKELQPRPYKLG